MDLTAILALDWPAIGGAFLGAGLATALIEGLFAFLRDRQEQRRRGTYLALRLATLLEGYAGRCAEHIQRNQNAPQHPDHEFPEWDISLPPLPQFPDDDAGWQALNGTLVARCLDLPNSHATRQGSIASVAEYSEDDLDLALDEQTVGIGLEAWKLAKELRARYKSNPSGASWDVADDLQRILDKAVAEAASRQEKQREWNRKAAEAFVAVSGEKPGP